VSGSGCLPAGGTGFWSCQTSADRRGNKKAPCKIIIPRSALSSSSIRTIPSVPELHRVSRLRGSQTVTAGGELHPALKIRYKFFRRILYRTL